MSIQPKSIITGGAGFIGSALARELLANGEQRVAIVDNLNSGRLSNLEAVKDQVEMHLIDIRDFDEVRRVFAGAEVVYHLAAIPSVPRSIKQPVPSHDVNINGTFNVYRAALETGVRRVVFAASSSAYGDTAVLPKTESMAPHPKSPYALQKLMGEYYGSVFTSCYGLETVALRFFNVYGPRQDPSSPYSGVLSLFMKAALARQAPTIFGDGEQSRDFTYVEDVAALVRKASTAPGVAGKVFNAGNGGRYTLNFLWEEVQKLEGISLPANYGPPREGDVRDSQADTASAVAELGHAPQFSISEGLRHTLDWYRTQHNG
ncbi:MAG TPA: SDR family oxidoreductase [Bryobacteraceae bacterium]|nr:SDR family oxidoreductase [Bryobacteraceae bacterium]